MNEVIQKPINLILIIVGTYLGIKLMIFLFRRKSLRNNANLFLGLYVLVLTSYFISGFFYRFDLLEIFPHIIGLQQSTHFLVGPLAYLYVRACTQQGFIMKPLLWLHFVPFGLELLYNMPFFLQDGAEKIAFYEQFIQTGKFKSSPILSGIKTIQGYTYLGLSIALILKYRKHLSNTASSIDTAYHRWLLFFIFMLALPLVVLLLFVVTKFHESYSILIILSGFITFLISLDIATLTKPELFHAFPHQMLLPTSVEEKKQKYESSKLQEDLKENYVKKLQTFMETEKPYLLPELTLAQLSEKIHIPAHYLSQVINEKLQVNFLDYINGYRVKEAQEKLLDPTSKQFTILSIAYESGFNSKSTFYAAFKKIVGKTPSQYRKENKSISL